MAHRPTDEAGVTRALGVVLRMTPAERSAGRFMRAPDHPGADGDLGGAVADAGDPGAADPTRRLEALLDDEGGDDGSHDGTDDGSSAAGADEDLAGDEGDLDNGEGAQDEGGEPDKAPAIAFPVSWGDDAAKEEFAQLPPAVQQQVADREAQRERAVQAATTEAATARRNAAAEANAAFAQVQRQYADAIEQVYGSQAPQAPDPALAATDPMGFLTLTAQHQAATAQHQQLMQQAAAARHQAAQRDEQNHRQEIADGLTALSQHYGDRWTDQAKRQELLTGITSVGAELGYGDLLKDANAQDLMALGKAAEWKAKAEKFDALQQNKMKIVRDAKNLPKSIRPGAAQPAGSAQAKATQQQRARLRQTGSVQDAAALIEARLS